MFIKKNFFDIVIPFLAGNVPLMWFFFILLTLTQCQKCPEKNPPLTKQFILGREEVISEGFVKRAVYQVEVPKTWTISEEENTQDTTKPNISFFIEKEIRINVHTFPTDDAESRIPPSQQIERWKRQDTSHSKIWIEPFSRAGFFGFFFEAVSEEKSIMAWALQLDLEHFQTLKFLNESSEEWGHYRQMAADVTIKVVGPTKLMKKHKKEISQFVKSFELIQEIPERV